MPPPIEPVQPDFDPAPAGETVVFDAASWRGGMPVSQEMYGRSAVAVYGNGGGNGRATLDFSLGEEPMGDATLTLTGLGDESPEPYRFRIEVNGQAVAAVTDGFPGWDGSPGAAGQWGQIDVTIPDGLLQSGSNQISVVSLEPGAHTNRVPYVLLAEATLSTGADRVGVAAVSQQVVAEVQADGGGRSSDGGQGQGENANQAQSRGSDKEKEEKADKGKEEERR